MIYLTDDSEELLLGIICKSPRKIKKIYSLLEEVYEKKLYEAETDFFVDFEDIGVDNLIIVEKDYFDEEMVDALYDEGFKILIV